ncbi:hypothetical protein [Thalassotalea fusca]
MKQVKRIGMLASVLLVMATAQQAQANTMEVEDTVKSFLVEQGKQLTVELTGNIKQSLAIEFQKFTSSFNVEKPLQAATMLSRNDNSKELTNAKSVEE